MLYCLDKRFFSQEDDNLGIFDVLVIAVALSMDAFAVSICKGLSVRKVKFPHLLAVGLYFGIFQALMPTIGYFLGKQFEKYITKFDHWIAFGLLLIIGVNMIREALSKEEPNEEKNSSFAVGTMLVLAVATSIDALAVGVSFALSGMEKNTFFYSAVSIGVVTCIISMLGLLVGNFFGAKYKAKAELAGGIILILIGTKILLEDLGLINLPF